jgi:A/G-specific adenine glycosylase
VFLPDSFDTIYTITSKSDITAFRKLVYSFYSNNSRAHLPWRTDYNPYHIFISEIMLQQTQVDRVINKFIDFTGLFPDFRSLADSSLEDVLAVWKGLGYNRRAVALRNAARIIIEAFGGALPDSPLQLKTLPGIGDATAASITAFAFNKPVVFLETNIRTVLIYHFFREKQNIDDITLMNAAEIVLDRKNPREWYSAMMDYGTMLKKSIGNESKKSRSYKKQTAFRGSRRELRGKILKVILENKSCTTKKLTALLDNDTESLLPVLSQLVNENIVRCERGKYLIAE